MSDCPCHECTVFDGSFCGRTNWHPVHWRWQLRTLIPAWLARHPGLPVYDAGVIATELGIVDVGFVGSDLFNISNILRETQRALRTCPQCDETGADLHSRETCDSCDGHHFDDTPIARVVGYSFEGERFEPECPECEEDAPLEIDVCECGATLRRALEVELARSIAKVATSRHEIELAEVETVRGVDAASTRAFFSSSDSYRPGARL